MFYRLEPDVQPETAVRWAQAVFDPSHGQELNCSDPKVVQALADQLGLDGATLLAHPAAGHEGPVPAGDRGAQRPGRVWLAHLRAER